MTVADPRGQVMDVIRQCYSSWMNTPDAGRIRVRWYKVNPAPGVYPLTAYCSSDWDEGVKDESPEIGEDSVARNPRDDWRNCCPPFWPEPSVASCAAALAPAWDNYPIGASMFWSDIYVLTAFPATVLVQIGPCVWRSPVLVVGGVSLQWTLTINPDGSATVQATTFIAGPILRLAFWDTDGPCDPGQPLVFQKRTIPAPFATGPPTLYVRGYGVPFIAIDSCTFLDVGVNTPLLI